MMTRLGEMRNEIFVRFDEITRDFLNKFADKAETKKALKSLEKQIKNMYELYLSLTSMTGNSLNADDAAFTTKSLNCASCTKGVFNMYGNKEFSTWSSMPYHNPARRLLRVG